MTALPTFATEANSLQLDVNTKQATATAAASTATAQATIATNAAAAAAVSAGATVWVSGTTYAIGQKVISPSDTLTYIRRTNGAGTTDPSLDSTNWNPAVPGITRVTSITSSTTLTIATMGIVSTAMTSIGQSVTMPDATTLTLGSPLAVIDNTKGSYPIGVRDNSGKLLMGIAAGGQCTMSLTDKTTAAGVWTISGINLEPGLISIDNTFSGTYNANDLPQFVAFDSNTSLHFAKISGGFVGYIVDNLGKVVSTPVTIGPTNTLPRSVFKVSPTTAIVFYDGNGTALATVVTLTGTTGSYSISVGTPQTAGTIASWGEDFTTQPRIAQLTSTLYMGAGIVSSSLYFVSLSVSGTSITIGATTSGTTVATGSDVTLYPLTSTTAFAIYKTGATTPYSVIGVVLSVSGTTTTINTAITGPIASSYVISPSSLVLSPTKIVVVDDSNDTAAAWAFVFTVSGTSITTGSALTVESSAGGIGSQTAYVGGGTVTRYTSHLTALSSTTALLWYSDFGGSSRAVILTESSGALTKGTIFYNSISTASVGTLGGGNILPTTGITNEFASLVARSGSPTCALAVVPCKISGTTITQGYSKPIDSPLSSDQYYCNRLSSGRYVISASLSKGFSGIEVFSSNGDAVAYLGSIGCPSLLATSGSYQAGVASNRLVVLGQTRHGNNALGTYQLRLLNVEII